MFSKEEKVLIWLSLFEFLSYKKKSQLIAMYDSVLKLWDNFLASNNDLLNIISEEDIKKMLFTKDFAYIDTYIKNCKDQNIDIVTIYSDTYSEILREIDTPPFVLYCKGNVELLGTKSIGIVGTRRPTKYGKDVTKQFATELAGAGLTVVSGLADGVDAVAHAGAIEAKGNTIAVLGCGVNEVYPVSNSKLYKEIEKHGLLVSEYKPNEKPQTYYFPARNRIVAGLSEGVLITEATEKSGTMHTKNYALDYNRNLFVVPGRISDKTSLGCNQIIQNLQASMVLSPKDILNAYNITVKDKTKNIVQLDFNDQIVFGIINTGDEDVHYEEILHKSNLDSKVLNTILIRLEIKGIIEKESGNYYRIVDSIL